MKLLSSLLVLISVLFFPVAALAQQGMTLSVTPPFFQLTISPEESWNSTIKVVNVNDYTLTLYASVVNFEARGESGQGKFTPLLTSDPDYLESSLAGWIDVTDKPITLAPGQSIKVPFSINAPENAPPGGHYAAILIGSEPIDSPDLGPHIAVSSFISTLIFARVAGDVVEEGDIRELSTEKMFFEEPDVAFTLRFENTGNVHLLPQGDISIFNMWGKERGIIPVNQKTEFGNVLPETVRKFSYVWSGESSPFEIGRYKAVATLSFGDDKRQNVTQSTAFWVIPVVPVFTTLGVLAFLIFITSWFIRRYIRKALGSEQARIRDVRTVKRAETLAAPLKEGVMDLRNVQFSEKEEEKEVETPQSMLKKYKMFLFFLVFVVIVGFVVANYLGEVLQQERSFEVQDVSE